MLVGRDSERAQIGALLEGARASRSGALVVRGEPGIGKTSLLDDARAQATGMHVLEARGIESESEIPFAGLHQLLRPALPLLEGLPSPQAAAMRGALGLDVRPADDRFLVSAGCLTLLSELADELPVLCVVDDAQWLDSPSAGSLLFVARRLDAEGVVMLFAVRHGDARSFEAPGLPTLELGALTDEAAAVLLAETAGGAPDEVRLRLLEETRGNPLALVELPSALSAAQLAGSEPLPGSLPLTSRVESVFLSRVRQLPDDTQQALLVAAADDSEDVGLVTRAAAMLGAAEDSLDSAERADLVRVDGARLEFRHPLVRSAVYDAATSSERREAHRALAHAIQEGDGDLDRRAWHLAASVLGRDETVAQELEDAATRASGRAGFMTAAKAFERSAEISASSTERGRRLALAARAASLAGADDYAVALARQAEPDVDDPVLRAEIARAIGAAAVRSGRALEGVPRLVDAARGVADLDAASAVEALVWVNAAGFSAGDADALADVARVSEALWERGVDEPEAMLLRALAVFPRALGGEAPPAAELEDVFAWGAAADDPEVVFVFSLAAHYANAYDTAAALLDRTISLARRRGELGMLAEALTTRAMRHIATQRFDEAGREAAESLEFARELGYVNVAARSATVLAYVAAIQGDDGALRTYGDEVFDVAARNGITPRAVAVTYATAVLDLSRSQWTNALDRLASVVAGAEPVLAKVALTDIVEAATRAGRPDDARDAFGRLTEWAGQSGPMWVQPLVASAQALVSDHDEAARHFEDALDLAEQARPFDLLRIRLLYGEHLRRQRRRTDSRVQLRAALEGFERIRAATWAERARSELRASGETARKRDPSTVDELTAQELTIARFVADGMSNKEVAAQLFLSPRTIDYHLRHVFSKLGITSRTQLARMPLGDESAGEALTVS